MRNKYLRGAHITEVLCRKILRLFCIDLTAVQVAELANVERNTVNRILQLIRARIYELAEKESCFGSGEIEVNLILELDELEEKGDVEHQEKPKFWE